MTDREPDSHGRRGFLQGVMGMGAALLAAPLSKVNAAAHDEMGLQLYTIRDPMAADPVATLKAVAALGYRNLETFGFDANAVRYYGMPASTFSRVLEDLSLRTTSGHYDLFKYLEQPAGQLRAYVDRCIAGALALKQQYITWPWLEPQNRTLRHFHVLAERLNAIGEQVRQSGLQVAYHNHDFEFTLHDGRIGYDIVMTETDPALVKLQLDLFWAVHSSARSPHELFALQPGRFVMWHIKDMDKRDRSKYTELGNGSIDFTSIMPDAALSGLECYFVEQGDNFAHDPMQSVATSAAYVRKYLE